MLNPTRSKKMKREIATLVVLCAACVEGANTLDGLKGKHTLTLSVRDRTPEKTQIPTTNAHQTRCSHCPGKPRDDTVFPLSPTALWRRARAPPHL